MYIVLQLLTAAPVIYALWILQVTKARKFSVGLQFTWRLLYVSASTNRSISIQHKELTLTSQRHCTRRLETTRAPRHSCLSGPVVFSRSSRDVDSIGVGIQLHHICHSLPWQDVGRTQYRAWKEHDRQMCHRHTNRIE